jgi:hypothetical protein
MQILNTDDTALPVVQSHAIRADLATLNATEVASFWFWLPKPSNPVEWPGFRLFVAADLGMFTYESSAGWGEPYISAGDVPREAWKLDGLFRPWSEFLDVSVTFSTAWDASRGARRPRRTFSSTRLALDVHEPQADEATRGSDQAAWRDFVRACIELAARPLGGDATTGAV